MSCFSNSRILITGGTGSFGKAFIAEILCRFPDIERLVVYSRDELKQWELQQLYPPDQFPQLRLFLGDVRDCNRLIRALEGIDTVVHAAALKQVPAAEYNPIEFINTNVLGSENVVQACLETDVKRVVALSTDKAAAPSTSMAPLNFAPISYSSLQITSRAAVICAFGGALWQCDDHEVQ